jgi:hypothetical protein
MIIIGLNLHLKKGNLLDIYFKIIRKNFTLHHHKLEKTNEEIKNIKKYNYQRKNYNKDKKQKKEINFI